MFSPRLNTVFASRWRALWFAASVLVSVYLAAPSLDQQAAHDRASRNAAEAANSSMAEGAEAPEEVKAAIAALNDTPGQ